MGAIAAVNGSYFNVKTREPVTYLKTDGRQVAPTTVREAGVDTDGILAISKWGRVSIFPGDTASCNRLCKKYKDACLRPHPAPRRAAGEGQLAGNRLLYKHHPRTKPYTFKQDKGASQSQDDRRDPVQKASITPVFGYDDVLRVSRFNHLLRSCLNFIDEKIYEDIFRHFVDRMRECSGGYMTEEWRQNGKKRS
ncbi:MAG: hypothetical protein IJ721_01955 [Bacteroidales bacterium]|nr:hypothetical protein [Bacteroidales bacterium]